MDVTETEMAMNDRFRLTCVLNKSANSYGTLVNTGLDSIFNFEGFVFAWL